MSIVNANKNNINSVVENQTVLLDFYSPTCGPCRTVSKILEQISQERNDVVIALINVDEEMELTESFKIQRIPTLKVIKNGKISGSAVGMKSKAHILSMLEK